MLVHIQEVRIIHQFSACCFQATLVQVRSLFELLELEHSAALFVQLDTFLDQFIQLAGDFNAAQLETID